MLRPTKSSASVAWYTSSGVQGRAETSRYLELRLTMTSQSDATYKTSPRTLLNPVGNVSRRRLEFARLFLAGCLQTVVLI